MDGDNSDMDGDTAAANAHAIPEEHPLIRLEECMYGNGGSRAIRSYLEEYHSEDKCSTVCMELGFKGVDPFIENRAASMISQLLRLDKRGDDL